MAGTSTFLLVLANPDAVTPYDPSSTGLPGDEHIYFTSERRVNHPWIAQSGDGPEAGPDISIGGQKLQLPLGRSVDGECQARIIDEPAPVTAVACDVNAVLLAEGTPGATYGLDATALGAGGWVKDSAIAWAPWKHWGANASGPYLGTFALFGWNDDGAGHTLGTWVRSTYIEKTLNGTEQGGPAWTDGQLVGFRFRVNWTLDTGGGNAFVMLVSGVGVTEQDKRLTGLTPSFDFWNVPENAINNQIDGTLYIQAQDIGNGYGEIRVLLGAENMYPSFNLTVQFQDMEVVECDTIVTGIDVERYYTGMLADADARQRTLGWPYYLKVSSDGGVTYDTMVYAGYHKQSTMERSLTYLLTGGDAGRGRRVSTAWAGLNPVEDFT